MYLIIDKVDEYIEEKMEINIKFLLPQMEKNKEVLTKYTELWDGIKNLIKKISDKPGDYGKNFVKIKFNSDNNLHLNKTLRLHNLPIIVRSVFQEDNKYYPKVF